MLGKDQKKIRGRHDVPSVLDEKIPGVESNQFSDLALQERPVKICLY